MKKSCCIAVLCILFSAQAVCAHEMALLPQLWQRYFKGQEVPVAVCSTHIFGISDALENPDGVRLLYNGQRVELVKNTIWRTCDGLVTLAEEGTAIIEALRAAQVRSELDMGWVVGGRDAYPNAKNSVNFEKYAKLLLPVGGKMDGYNRFLGHRLEIVPVDNPFAARIGDELRFIVLLDGKPAYIDEVRATYNGFSNITGAWAWRSDPSAHGEATIRITHAGIWNVNVDVEVPAVSRQFEKENIRAVLTFPVNGL